MRIRHTAVVNPADVQTDTCAVALPQAVRLEDGCDAAHRLVAGVGEGEVVGLVFGGAARVRALEVDVFAVEGGEGRNAWAFGEERGSGRDGEEGEDTEAVCRGGADGEELI